MLLTRAAFIARILMQVRDQEDRDVVASAVQRAQTAKQDETVSQNEHQQILDHISGSKRKLHELQQQRTVELAARAAATAELGGKRTEIAKLQEKMAAASQQMQSKHAAKAVESAAKLMEARAVRT